MKNIILMIFGLFVCACSMLLEKPEVKVRDLGIVGIGPSGVDLEFLVTVTNPNSFPLILKGYSYDLRVMALPLTRGEGRERIDFAAGKSTDVRIPFRVAYGDLWDIVKRNPDPERIPYDLDARFEVETPLGAMKVPVSKGGEFSVPDRYRGSALIRGVRELLNGFGR